MRTRAAQAAAGVALLAVLAVGTLAARSPAVRGQAARLAGLAGDLPTPHWLAFAAVQLAVAAFGFLPASLMAVAAGAAYGMAGGLAVSVAGTMGGGWLALLLSRSVLRPWVERLVARYPGAARFDEAVAREGWRFVCLLRISPVMPFAATSYGLGLTRIGQREYLLGTLASLPALAGYVALGAFGRAGLMTEAGGPASRLALPALAVLTFALAAVRLRRLMRA